MAAYPTESPATRNSRKRNEAVPPALERPPGERLCGHGLNRALDFEIGWSLHSGVFSVAIVTVNRRHQSLFRCGEPRGSIVTTGAGERRGVLIVGVTCRPGSSPVAATFRPAFR